MKKVILLVVMLTAFATARSQSSDDSYMFDMGVGLGIAGYNGDASPRGFFNAPGVRAEADLRYLKNSRICFAAALGFSSLHGNTENFKSEFPVSSRGKFSSSVADFSFTGEFNFLPFGVGQQYMKLSRITPFVFAGAGVVVAHSAGCTSVSPAFPFGVGFKYKATERINFSLKVNFTKTFTDSLDGKKLNDPYEIGSVWIKNTDWFAGISAGISVEFGRRCATCNYIAW